MYGGQPAIHAGTQRLLHQPGDAVGQPRPRAAEGHKKHQQHHGQKQGDCQILVRCHRVNPFGSGALPLPALPPHGRTDDTLHKAVPAVCQQGLPVPQGALGLVFRRNLVNAVPGGLVQPQVLGYLLVPRQQLDRRPVGRDAYRVGPVVDQGVNPVVDGVGKVVVEVVRLHGQAGVHLPVGLLDQPVNIHAVTGGDRDHRYAQLSGQPAAVNRIPLLFHLVHEVYSQHHRPFQLQQLHGQIQVPLQVGGVYDVDDGVRLLLEDEFPGHHLLHGVGREGVDARQVHHREAQLP